MASLKTISTYALKIFLSGGYDFLCQMYGTSGASGEIDWSLI